MLENTVIQSGWDIHSKEVQTDSGNDQSKRIINNMHNSNFENNNKKEVMLLKKANI
jgi:hypothetical protein